MIYGKRIRFRRTEKGDLPHFVRWLNDPEVRFGIASYLPMSMHNEEKWFERMNERPIEEQALVLEVRDGDDWKMIGNCAFFDTNQRVRSAEIGILIGEKDYWNKGYGTEAMVLLLKLGFETLNLNRIYLRVNENNPGAIRCYEKAGYVHEGRQRQAEFTDGEYVDLLTMSVLREEWLARPAEERE